MNEVLNSYPVKRFEGATKRYVRTLCLRNNEQLIAEYRRRHAKENIWHEIIDGLKQVGVLEMEIYIHETFLTMIVETPADFQWDDAMTRLASMPRQQEWEDFMAEFQKALPGETSAEKWKPMERMFYFYD